MDPKSIATQVKVRRKAHDFTLESLAKATGLSKQTVWRLEQGDAEPAADTLDRVARVLKCTVDDLLHGDVLALLRSKPASSDSGTHRAVTDDQLAVETDAPPSAEGQG